MARVFIPSNLNHTSPPPPLNWSPTPHPSNPYDPHEFGRGLCQMWWRIPEPEQGKITLLVSTNVDTLTSGYALLEYIMTRDPPLDTRTIQKIKEIIHSTPLLSLNQKRAHLLQLYASHHLELRVEQRELLAGIVAHMAQQPIPESAERVIASGLTNGCDFEAFELFAGLLMKTVEINEARRSV